MNFDVVFRRTHRIIAVFFLLLIPPAAYGSMTATGTDVSFVVYLPLFPLFGLILTGSYLLVRPWIHHLRKRTQ